MNNAKSSGKPQNSPSISGEDIPLALRDTPDAAPPNAAPKVRVQPLVLVIGGLVGFILLAVFSGFLFFALTPKKKYGFSAFSC